MNSTKKIIGLALVSFITLTAGAIAAPATDFTGSRADVRSFCTGEDDFLLEGGSFTLCLTPVTDVVCRDDHFCASSNFDMAVAEGFRRLDVATR